MIFNNDMMKKPCKCVTYKCCMSPDLECESSLILKIYFFFKSFKTLIRRFFSNIRYHYYNHDNIINNIYKLQCLLTLKTGAKTYFIRAQTTRTVAESRF